MSAVALLDRPQRWDTPFDLNMTQADVDSIKTRAPFSEMSEAEFPAHTPLDGILLNDTRLLRVKAGDIIVREGDYGNSAFLILEGALQVVLHPDLPPHMLGRETIKKKGPFATIAQLWRNSKVPEQRDTSAYGPASSNEGVRGMDDSANARVYLQDIPAVLDEYSTARLEEGALFGELAALGRVPRTATVFAEEESLLLEVRWQGLREFRKYDEAFRRSVDEKYRENALVVHLREHVLFRGLPEEALQEVANATLFETYGSFDWNISYKKMRAKGQTGIANEPIIAREGDYPDGLLMIRAGFARVSKSTGNGHRTLTYLSVGDHFGYDELYDHSDGNDAVMETTLSALGYVDVLRVPAPILEKYIFSGRGPHKKRLSDLAKLPLRADALEEWAVDRRYINGTQSMLIDMDKCVRCDDCVRACASTHDGNPRFIRHGEIMDHWMVANACMHCTDPVCMIGCPTGAIHRSLQGGMVIINDTTCVGCATCANSCPYDNIRMVEIRDTEGRVAVDPTLHKPIVKATKCDLCANNPGGPACVRACPHDAMRRVDFQSDNPFSEAGMENPFAEALKSESPKSEPASQ